MLMCQNKIGGLKSYVNVFNGLYPQLLYSIDSRVFPFCFLFCFHVAIIRLIYLIVFCVSRMALQY